MQAIYEANVFPAREDFDTIEEAKAFVEAKGSGHVTKFIRGFDGKDRSCALITFDGKNWNGVDITR